ncbi:MAG TPA: hypothetical protein VF660_01685 [Actinomycetota bacterium]|jgi:uncharacterized integral membrane protein
MHREHEDHGSEPASTSGDLEAPRSDQDHLRELQRARQGRVIKVFVALAIAIILIVFILTNSQAVAVNFVFVKRRPRLIWVMFGCAVLGGIVGYLIGRPGKQVTLHRQGHQPGDHGES